MKSLSPEQRALLSPRERAAFAIADRVNRGPVLKQVATRYLRMVGCQIVSSASKNLLYPQGVDNLARLAPERGVLVASNHRSFFDLYVISEQMLRTCPWIESMYFPVRSDFFYTHPAGTAVNAAASALAMYPPIFRDPKKRPLNDYAVELLKEQCLKPGTVIGIHPEGKRGTGDDPYELLPAKAGTGEIIYHANPIVLPVFLLGIGNDLGKQWRSNQNGTGEPITVNYGTPLDLSSYLARPATNETYKAISNAVCDAIRDLGEQDRKLRRDLGLPPPRALRKAGSPDSGASTSSGPSRERGVNDERPSSPHA